MQIYTLKSSNVCMEKKCPALINMRNFMLFHDNTKPYSVKFPQENKIYLSWSVLIHPALLYLVISVFFPFLQNALNDKKISK